MRNGTRLGLSLIALAWLAASIGVSAHFVDKAQRERSQHDRLPDPRVYRGSIPTGIAECMRIALPVGSSEPSGLAKL